MLHAARCLAVALSLFASPAFCLDANGTSANDTTNEFREPLRYPPFNRMAVREGIPTSPFALDHPVEQMAYETFYIAKYNANLTETRAVVPETLPRATDAAGRPLWFDGKQSEYLRTIVERLYRYRQYDDLDRLFDDWNDPNERLADGRWKLVIFHNAMGAIFLHTEDWQKSLADVHEWRRAKPSSRGAMLTEALFWHLYAWNARGPGTASSVSPDGWRLFTDRLREADRILRDTRALTGASPLWGRVALEVNLGLRTSVVDMLKLFADVTSQEKRYYPHYTSMANALSPRWGGSWDLVDRFVRAAINADATDRFSLYARIYWTLREQMPGDFDLFGQSRANWPDMKRSFEELTRAYPHSAVFANNFAAAACMARDKAVYQTLRTAIGKTITRESWPQNYSTDLCDATLGGPQL